MGASCNIKRSSHQLQPYVCCENLILLILCTWTEKKLLTSWLTSIKSMISWSKSIFLSIPFDISFISFDPYSPRALLGIGKWMCNASEVLSLIQSDRVIFETLNSLTLSLNLDASYGCGVATMVLKLSPVSDTSLDKPLLCKGRLITKARHLLIPPQIH